MRRRIRVDRDTAHWLPPSVQEWLPKDRLARYVGDVVEALDLSGLISPSPLATPPYSTNITAAGFCRAYSRRGRGGPILRLRSRRICCFPQAALR